SGRVGEIIGPAEVIKRRRRLVEIAQRYSGRVDRRFRTKEVRGGKLACAKVVTTMLQEAGFLDEIYLGVDASTKALLRAGWTVSTEPAEPGDVVIWGPLGRKKRRTSRGTDVIPGHKHIGIALGPNWVVSNSSKRGLPREHKLYTGRTVEAILKPPGSKSGTGREAARRTRARDASLERATASTANEKMNAAIEGRLSKYEPIIRRAAEKHGVDADLIRAVIMQESGGRPHLASHAKAGGLMQLIPLVARIYKIEPIYPIVKKTNSRGKPYYRLDPRDGRMDPEANIMAGTALIKNLLKMHKGNVTRALASYNWGSGNYSKFMKGKKRMPKETQNYISHNSKKGAIGKYLSLKAGKGKKPAYEVEPQVV
ncbi:lytic transglycosylase domain-containing protein, partial [Pseudomonadota bacterium]